jgi:methyl-accepting chemotaxis protein
MPKLDHDTLELLLISVTAICILFQTILLAAVLIAVRKGVASVTENVNDLRASAMPVIDHTRGFVERMTPKVEETAKNVSEMSRTLKDQTTKISTSASEIAQRVNVQSSRVDVMVTGALDAVDRAADLVVETVNKPVRQLSGILASIKAALEVLGASKPNQRASHSAPHSTAHPADEFEDRSEPMI